MKRDTFTITVIFILDILLILIFDIIDYSEGTRFLGLFVPGLLTLIGLSCLNDKCYKFWNKKIKFKK